jgi:hypothetical protein
MVKDFSNRTEGLTLTLRANQHHHRRFTQNHSLL